ncbi:MAG: hypothetical protein IJ262_00530 [Clostridia bacterium]|nr:hypothetical protein [Clostridia bacterium]
MAASDFENKFTALPSNNGRKATPLAASNFENKFTALPSSNILRSEIQFTDTKILCFEGAAVARRLRWPFQIAYKKFQLYRAATFCEAKFNLQIQKFYASRGRREKRREFYVGN